MSYRLTKLYNGVTLLTVPQPGALSVSVMALVDAGAKDEEAKTSGISHFLEHMGFKGTTKRPSSMILSSEMEALGANYNASTGHDVTAYYVTVIPERAKEALDLISDLYLNPLCLPEEVEKEKGVIIEEIKLYEDNPTSFVWDVFSQLAYSGTPAGRLIIGKRETVSSFSREDILNYRAKHYLAGATTIIAVGNFDEEKMILALSEKFGSLPAGEKKECSPVQELQTEPRIELVKRPIDQSHFVLGFKSATLFDDKIYPLTVLASVLGGGMSSRLFQKVREELGAAYYLGASQQSHLDHGFLSVHAGVDSGRLSMALQATVAELKKIKEEIIPEEELNRVKDHLIGRLFLGLETPSDQTYFYGEQVLLRRGILSPQQYADKIRAVTAAELQALAQEIFCSERLNLAIVGPDCPIEEIKGIINDIE